MKPTLRGIVSAVLLGLTATWSSAGTSPTPAPEPSPPDQPKPPKEDGATSKPAKTKAGIDLSALPGVLDDDEGTDLPAGLKQPKYDAQMRVWEYLKPSADQQKLWVQYQKTKAEESLKKVSSLRCTLVESEHYLIYTDWPASDHSFLKSALENLFSQYVKMFDIDKSDQAKFFLGKMPVFCVETKEEFGRLSMKAFGNPVPEGVLGYCQNTSWGNVKLVLYRTEPYRGKTWKVRWAEVTAHEHTHAFVARYRSNRFIPPWMNEGLAEYFSIIMAEQVGGHVSTEISDKGAESIREAQRVARSGQHLREPLFEFPASPAASMYPVAWSLTKMLIESNAKGYVQMIRDIKDGVTASSTAKEIHSMKDIYDNPGAENALQKNFRCDYDKLEEIWHPWVLKLVAKTRL